MRLKYMRGEEDLVGGYIILVGVVVIVGLMVVFSNVFLTSIDVPEDQYQTVDGSEQTVANRLISLSQRCWELSGEGGSETRNDCFVVTVEGPENDVSELVERDVEVPEEMFLIDKSEITEGSEVVISYYPEGFNGGDERIVLR